MILKNSRSRTLPGTGKVHLEVFIIEMFFFLKMLYNPHFFKLLVFYFQFPFFFLLLAELSQFVIIIYTPRLFSFVVVCCFFVVCCPYTVCLSFVICFWLFGYLLVCLMFVCIFLVVFLGFCHACHEQSAW